MKIKFLHYNIAACRNYEVAAVSPVKPERTLEIIKSFDADIVTINEIDCLTARSGKIDQPKLIAESMGYNYYFAPAIECGGGDYGIALFSKYDIVSAEMIRIPDTYIDGVLQERRVIISAILNAGGQQLRVMMSHYGLSGEEQRKAAELTLSELEKSTLPTIFSGDLNITPDNPLIGKLSEKMTDTGLLFEKEPITYPSSNFLARAENVKIKIDYIFTHGNIKAEHVEVPEIHVSDHRPYYCELSL